MNKLIYNMKKSKALAVISFIFGLMFWVPLINFIFGALAIYFGFKAVGKIKRDPTKYKGKWFAVVGIILGAIVYIMYFTGIAMCLFGYKEICKNIGLNLLAK